MATVLLVSVVAVNLVTIAADLQAGAAGIGLLAGVDPHWQYSSEGPSTPTARARKDLLVTMAAAI